MVLITQKSCQSNAKAVKLAILVDTYYIDIRKQTKFKVSNPELDL